MTSRITCKHVCWMAIRWRCTSFLIHLLITVLSPMSSLPDYHDYCRFIDALPRLTSHLRACEFGYLNCICELSMILIMPFLFTVFSLL
ncbi:hypothetical protein BJ165DRAFT_1519768, partial [Panaeolus papilionaceus]